MGSFSVVSPELRRLFPLVNVSASTAFAARRISNLQPRDSRALAFPRGLDYLILRGSVPGRFEIEIDSSQARTQTRRPVLLGGDYCWGSPR